MLKTLALNRLTIVSLVANSFDVELFFSRGQLQRKTEFSMGTVRISWHVV